MREIKRSIENYVIRSLEAFPVVYIAGPRQSGKTTLVQRIATTRHKAKYITFDDIQARSSVQRDPEAFLRSLDGPVVLDEVQMAPELFQPLKIIVDENRKCEDGGRGRFLLAGSASVMALPKLAEALVGRMTLHTLLPFSTGEVQEDTSHLFVDRAFSMGWKFDQQPKEPFNDMIIKASFPELLKLKSRSLHYEWCNSYINTILQRDVRILMEIEKIGILPNMLRLLATRTGGLLNESGLARDTSLNHITVKRYRRLLESLFLTNSIPPWSGNLGKRLVKTPKVYINDLNLFAYLLNIDLDDLPQENPMLFGQILENFIAVELTKQLTFSKIRASIYHYRTASGQEIDFLIEGPQNHIVGVEVKARSKANARDFRHLEALKNDLGNNFQRGFVFYQGSEIIPFGKDMWAVPIASLWR